MPLLEKKKSHFYIMVRTKCTINALHDKDAPFIDCVITNVDQFEMPPSLPKKVGINTIKLDKIKKTVVAIKARSKTYILGKLAAS